jgi:hypothetical protein
MRHNSPNKPAAPNAGIAFRLPIEHHWPGVGEPGRWALQLTFWRYSGPDFVMPGIGFPQ